MFSRSIEFANGDAVNIVHLNQTDLTGRRFNGFDLHLRQMERGHRACCIVDRKETNDPDTFIHDVDAIVGELDRPTHFEYAVTKELLSSSQFLHADVIHLHLVYDVIFALQYLPIMAMLKPVVWTLHDPWLLCGGCVYPGSCEKWKTHCFDCVSPQGKSFFDTADSALFFEMKRQAVQSAKIEFMVASEWMHAKTLRSPVTAGKPIHLIPFGLDERLFSPGDGNSARTSLFIAEDDIVFLARKQEIFKRYDIVESALASLRLNGRRVTLLLVGGTDECDFGANSNAIDVKCFGWVAGDNLLRKLYQACDLLLMPSDNEAFGLMAAEAMSCGKMVLALDSPESALPEVIDAPDSGLAVAEAAYGRELQRLIDNPAEIRERGRRSLAFARKRYDRERYERRILEVYEQAREKFVLSDCGSLVLEQLGKQGAPSLLKSLNFEQTMKTVHIIKKV